MDIESGSKTEQTKFSSILSSISKWLAVLACCTLGVMMLFVTIDVAGRDLFNWPLRGTFEIVGLLLIVASTWGTGFCQMEKRHLRIPLFYDMLPPKVRLGCDILAYGAGLVVAGIITWQTLLLAMKYLRLTVGNTTQTLGLPLVPFMLALALGLGWLFVVLLVDLYKSGKEVIRK